MDDGIRERERGDMIGTIMIINDDGNKGWVKWKKDIYSILSSTKISCLSSASLSWLRKTLSWLLSSSIIVLERKNILSWIFMDRKRVKWERERIKRNWFDEDKWSDWWSSWSMFVLQIPFPLSLLWYWNILKVLFTNTVLELGTEKRINSGLFRSWWPIMGRESGRKFLLLPLSGRILLPMMINWMRTVLELEDSH